MMDDNKEIRTGNEPEPENPGADKKLFTQADVDRIVEKRLARYKAAKKEEAGAADERETALTARENEVACREYILENGYPSDLLDMIGSEDPDSFKAKADKFAELIQAKTPVYPSVKDHGEVNKVSDPEDFAAAFARDNVHVPRKPKNNRW